MFEPGCVVCGEDRGLELVDYTLGTSAWTLPACRSHREPDRWPTDVRAWIDDELAVLRSLARLACPACRRGGSHVH